MPQQQTPRIEQWVDISTFNPGCYNASFISGAKPIVMAPQAAATPTTTYQCMGLNNGGLGPLPELTTSYSYPARTGNYHPLYQVGFITNPTTKGVEILHMIESENGPGHLFQVRSFHTWNGTYHTAYGVVNSKSTGYFCCPYPVMTRMVKTATATSKPGNPQIVFPWSDPTDAHGNSGHLFVYPEITHPTNYTLTDLIVTKTGHYQSVTGQVIAHQGRVVVFAGVTYSWPIGTGVQTNEQVCYTTPSNSDTYKFQQEIFVPEYPYGYGGAGSISASELFLIKKRGGGVVVTGDISNPSITFLPGVQSTGDIYGQAGPSPAGLFYCSDKQGAWMWNGSNTAQKISNQLQDDFYIVPDITPLQNNICYYAHQWGNWVLFSNSWIYNLTTSSWWNLTTTSIPLFYYQPGESSDTIYAGVQTIKTTNSTIFAYKIDKSTPVQSWQWKSLPMRLSENKYIDIREIMLYASNPDASATSQIEVSIWINGSYVFSFITQVGEIGVYPHLLRIPCGVVTAENIICKIRAYSASGHSAPILHQISFGIKTRQHIATL